MQHKPTGGWTQLLLGGTAFSASLCAVLFFPLSTPSLEWCCCLPSSCGAVLLWLVLAATSSTFFSKYDVNRTPTHTACTDAHSASAHTLHSVITCHHANTRGSRASRLRIARIGVPKRVCHPRVMSRSLPHLTLTTSTSSLSPTSPIFQSFSPSHPSPFGARSIYTLRWSTAEWRIHWGPICHR